MFVCVCMSHLYKAFAANEIIIEGLHGLDDVLHLLFLNAFQILLAIDEMRQNKISQDLKRHQRQRIADRSNTADCWEGRIQSTEYFSNFFNEPEFWTWDLRLLPHNNLVLMIDPMRIMVRLVLNWKFLEIISRFCATLSAICCQSRWDETKRITSKSHRDGWDETNWITSSLALMRVNTRGWSGQGLKLEVET